MKVRYENPADGTGILLVFALLEGLALVCMLFLRAVMLSATVYGPRI